MSRRNTQQKMETKMNREPNRTEIMMSFVRKPLVLSHHCHLFPAGTFHHDEFMEGDKDGDAITGGKGWEPLRSGAITVTIPVQFERSAVVRCLRKLADWIEREITEESRAFQFEDHYQVCGVQSGGIPCGAPVTIPFTNCERHGGERSQVSGYGWDDDEGAEALRVLTGTAAGAEESTEEVPF
jgi:hypothetical protein